MEFNDVLERLRGRTQMPLFVAQPWDEEVSRALCDADLATFFVQPVRDPKLGAAAIAGLHLWNDDFHGSHNLCQGIQTTTGSYWHGLCHRREGHQGEGLQSNLSNAKYWFRQVGEHPAFDPVYRMALNVLDTAGTGFRWATEAGDNLRARHKWDPNAMIDWFAQVEAGTLSAQSAALLEEIQWREIDLLVNWCVEHALS